MVILFGILVGGALGLTGGGGSIFAVPLLVHGLHLPIHQAVGVSLAAVGLTACAGAVIGVRRKIVELRSGVIFAAGGIIAAPIGVWVGRQLPGAFLLMSFGVLMVVIAVATWHRAAKRPKEAQMLRADIVFGSEENFGPTCRVNPEGVLTLTAPCAGVLITAGLLTGLFAGLFGVGGGFVIVPALMFVTNLSIHRAVATSLFVIALVSASGFISLMVFAVAFWLR